MVRKVQNYVDRGKRPTASRLPGADLWGDRRETPGPPQPGRARALMRQNSQRLIRTVVKPEKPWRPWMG